MKIAEFLQKMYSNGQEISFNRVAASMILVFCLGWDTAILVFIMMHWQQLHITVNDLYPATAALLAQAGFIWSGYTIAKVRDAVPFSAALAPPDSNQTPTQ